MACPKCGKELGQHQTHCDKCGIPVDSQSAGTGNLTNYGPDQAKPKKPKFFDPNKNIQLAEVLFDASTGRFIYAEQDHSDAELERHRKKHFPDLDDLPQVDPKSRGKKHEVYKGLQEPETCRKKQPSVDEISKSCTDLAIDG